MQEALNEQIKNELYSAYMYLSMATYFDANNWEGFAKWMKLQAQEEYAMKIHKHLNDRGIRVIFKALD